MIKRILMFVLGLFFLIAGLMIGVGVYISPKNDLEQSSAIVAISGGDTEARTKEAVRLYQEGWAPQLIFSGAALDPNSPSNARVMKKMAVSSGVPPDVIEIDEASHNTRQNADQAADFIEAFGHKQIILVTSPYHQRRAFIEFDSRLSDDVAILNNPAPDTRWSKQRWWRSPFGWYITASEVPKIIYSLSQSR